MPQHDSSKKTIIITGVIIIAIVIVGLVAWGGVEIPKVKVEVQKSGVTTSVGEEASHSEPVLSQEEQDLLVLPVDDLGSEMASITQEIAR